MACDSSVPEPDLALCMEVCDNINMTKKNSYVSKGEIEVLIIPPLRARCILNSPHEAAIAILEYVNGSESHQAMLALNVRAVGAWPIPSMFPTM